MTRKVGVAILALGISLMSLLAINSQRSTAAPAVYTGSVPSEYAVPISAFGIRFGALDVSPGAHAILPDGKTGITMTQAVAAAMPHTVGADANGLLAGVQVSAQYGMFSDDVLAQRLPSGQMEPLFQNKPAWIVTFYGPGVLEYSHGPPRALSANSASAEPSAAPDVPVHHEENVVVDAETAAFMELYS